MLVVGPYRFTNEDARNTIAAAITIIDQMSEGRPTILAAARHELRTLVTEGEHEPATVLEPVWNILMAATPT